MTEKAAKILQKMKRRDGKKASRLSRSSEARERVLGELNRSTLDDAVPIGSEHGVRLLEEMNELDAQAGGFIRLH